MSDVIKALGKIEIIPVIKLNNINDAVPLAKALIEGGIPAAQFGGISLNNLAEYSTNKNVIACGGSFMVTETLIKREDWTEITKLCKQAVTIIKAAREGK